jgi:hypothetical protein
MLARIVSSSAAVYARFQRLAAANATVAARINRFAQGFKQSVKVYVFTSGQLSREAF